MERRKHPRIYEPFRVKVSGTDAAGQKFQTETALDNLSAGGLYVRLPWNVQQGSKLFIVVQMSTANKESVPVARVPIPAPLHTDLAARSPP